MKKFLCVILSLAMVISSCAVIASASGEVKGEITICNIKKVISYRKNNFYSYLAKYVCMYVYIVI